MDEMVIRMVGNRLLFEVPLAQLRRPAFDAVRRFVHVVGNLRLPAIAQRLRHPAHGTSEVTQRVARARLLIIDAAIGRILQRLRDSATARVARRTSIARRLSSLPARRHSGAGIAGRG